MSQSMKKKLSLFIAASVFALGIVGALAVVPHVHGKDFNHSQHQTCPIYQFGIGNVHADVSHAAVIIALFIFCFLIEIRKVSHTFFSRSSAHSRAPPILS